MQKTYSPRYRLAFAKYQQAGAAEMSDADVEAIEAEDKPLGQNIRDVRADAAKWQVERERRREIAPEPQPQPAPPPPPTKKPTWSDDALGKWLKACWKCALAKWPEGTDTDEAVWKTFFDDQRGLPHKEVRWALTPLLKLIRRLNLDNQERNDRFDAMAKRIEALEAAPRGLAYKGVWQPALVYRRHDCATYNGSMWICVVDQTEGQPSKDRGWQLAVKGRAE